MSNDKRTEHILESMIRYKEFKNLLEGTLPFLIYRVDTGAVLARGIYGYEAAKGRASELRKRLGLKFENVKFKADRSSSHKTASPQQSSSRRIEYAPRYNPSKRTRFSGYYDSQGNYHDIS